MATRVRFPFNAVRGIRRLPARVRRRLEWALRRLLPCPREYFFLPAPSVVHQEIRFRYCGSIVVVQAGHNIPLYETVAEIVDYDCYQLRRVASDLRGGVIIDIGANVGVAALCLSQHSGSTVLCFEPVPENCAWLRSNLSLNNVSNVVVRPEALARRTGTVAMHVPEHEAVGARVVDEASPEWGARLEVASVDLGDALASIREPVSFMKVDCEGSEYDLVDQLTPDLVTRVERLSFEIHDRGDDRSVRTISHRLKSLGYVLNHMPDAFGRPTLHHVLAIRKDLDKGHDG